MSLHRNTKSSHRDLHYLNKDGMVACNPRDREAAHRAEVEGIATEDMDAVTCMKCWKIIRRERNRSRWLNDSFICICPPIQALAEEIGRKAGVCMISIREVCEEDAERFLALCHQLDWETQFMLLEPGERSITLEEQRERIKSILARDNQTILVAQDQQGQLTGYLSAIGGDYNRNRYTAYLVIGIL